MTERVDPRTLVPADDPLAHIPHGTREQMLAAVAENLHDAAVQAALAGDSAYAGDEAAIAYHGRKANAFFNTARELLVEMRQQAKRRRQ